MPRFSVHRILLFAVVTSVLVGCSAPPKREISTETIRFAALPNGHDPYNPEELTKTAGGAQMVGGRGVIRRLEKLHGHSLNIIELSGGGQNGAFGAGFLKGWRKTGTRPEFDVVTGVSTGALLATHAFLGTPADDAVLEKLFTQTYPSKIYRKRGVLSGILDLITGGRSFFDTSPMAAMIDEVIDMDVLRRVAKAHDNNRRLWVGTTNMDYDQTWVWSMSAIAKQGDQEALELYKKVLRASASPPIAFPPVEIDGHLFADGSVRQNIVVVGLTGTVLPMSSKFGPGNKYVIRNGKDSKEPYAIQNAAVNMVGPALNIMMNNSMDTVLLRSYLAARIHDYNFHITSIPKEVASGNNILAFNNQEMRNAFDAGFALAQQENAWRTAPKMLTDLPVWVLQPLRNTKLETKVGD